jgi:NitT/TauT family transport system ATP-binding protein
MKSGGTGPDGKNQKASVIHLDQVSKTFGPARGGRSVAAVQDVSLTIEEGTFVALLGPSGCGKTTVLRLIDGLIKPDSGSVSVFGATPSPGPEIGFVFQSFRLIPWATVHQNIDFALQGLGLATAERRERVEHYLQLVGLTRFAEAYPRTLSGGMKQRVALARALAPEPKVLLMDEPFASIDAQTRELMQLELMRIWTHRRPAVVFVTHSVDEAIVLADRVAVMGTQPGRVIDTIDVDLERPRWTYDARAEPRFVELRRHLSQVMREMVVNDPSSDFYGHDLGGTGTGAPRLVENANDPASSTLKK